MGKFIDATEAFMRKRILDAREDIQRAQKRKPKPEFRATVACGVAPLSALRDRHWSCVRPNWAGIQLRSHRNEECSRCAAFIIPGALAWRWMCCGSVYCLDCQRETSK